MFPVYRIGTSGWSYKHWDGDFYPKELPNSRWLEHYAQHFNSVEVNNSFYRLPSESTVKGWGRRVPEGFIYTFKVSRYITHIQRFRNAAEALHTFIERVQGVGTERMGALLYQTPPGLHKDVDLLEGFVKLLPPGRHHVFEFRHASWFAADVLDLLRRHDVCFCVQDMHGMECPVATTGPAAYFRFHGPTEQAYSGSYSHDQLAEWARRIRSAGEAVETVYAYFNNDVGGHAVRNAITLREMLEG